MFACRAKALRPRVGTTWHLDDLFVKLRGYPATKAGVAKLVGVKHVFVKASARVINRTESRHQPTRWRELQMQGFRDPRRTQHFALPSHSMDAATHRAQMKRRQDSWYE